MDKDFDQYVYARIERVLKESDEYMKLQEKLVKAQKNNENALAEDLDGKLGVMAEELCYRQGFKDAMAIILGKNI